VSLALQALQKKDLPLIATQSLFLMVKQFEAFNAPRTTKLIHFVKRTLWFGNLEKHPNALVQA